VRDGIFAPLDLL